VPAALADADLVVGRSGASAVSEITAVGRPSLLVPYPFASGDHQRVNARALERAGAAVLVPSAAATSERLARELEALALADGALERMAAAARAFGRPGAAREVALDFLRLVGLEAATEPTARSEIGESS
jgi:UDP-N-acetylglucosamine--N-acetylmuramyl-(pentapeptide) pyrophosphoryl-undecaprenol N-acetylglucosamine transferase